MTAVGDTIRSNTVTADAIVEAYLDSFQGYIYKNCLEQIYKLAPYSANDVHDSFSASILEATNAWGNLMKADAKMISEVAEEFSSIDLKVASKLMGRGVPCSSSSIKPRML